MIHLPGATFGISVSIKPTNEELVGRIVLLVKGDEVLNSASKNGNKINIM